MIKNNILKFSVFLLVLTVFLSQIVTGLNLPLQVNNRVFYSYQNITIVGSHVVDNSSNNINGALINSPPYANGYFDDAREFIPTGDHIDADNYTGTYIDGEDLSFETWFILDTTGTTRQLVTYSAKRTGTTVYFRLGYDPTNGILFGIDELDVAETQIFTPFSDTGVWHHAVATFNDSNSQMKLYLDGDFKVSGTSNNIETQAGMELLIGELAWNVMPMQPWDGKIDETYVYNKTLSASEVLEKFNLIVNIYKGVSVSLNESLEKTFEEQIIGTININSATYSTILSTTFNTSKNNSELYVTSSFGVDATGSNDLGCRILVNGTDFESEITGSNVGNVFRSIYMTTQNITFNQDEFVAELQCKKTGAGIFRIHNPLLIVHELVDERNVSLKHTFLNVNASVVPGSFSNIGSALFTTSDLVADGVHNATIVVNWNALYLFNTSGELNSFVSIRGVNSKNCSFYPRGSLGGFKGSVGGDCILENAGFNNTYNVSFFGKGNGSMWVNFHIKEFVLDKGEVNSTLLNGTIISGSTLTILKTIGLSDVDHGGVSLFAKAGIPHVSGSSTESFFALSLDGGIVNTTAVQRTTNKTTGVTIVQFLFLNLSVGSHNVSLLGSCDNSDCNITGGELVAYFVNPLSFVSNDFTVVATDIWDNSSINTFNVTISNGNTFSTTSGTIDVGSLLALENLTFTTPNFITRTVFNHNTSNALNVSLKQTDIRFDVSEIVTLTNLSANFTISNRQKTVFNLQAGTHTVTITKAGYFNVTNSITVAAKDNKTINLSGLYNVKLRFQAKNNLTGQFLNNFTINLTDQFGTLGFNQSLSTSNGNLTFNITNNANYSSLIDNADFAIFTANHTSFTTLTNFTYQIFTTNSLNIRFIFVHNLSLTVGTNVSIQFIGLTSTTKTTTNGTLFVDLFTPDEYTLLYDADGYEQGKYIITITNRSNTNLTLYVTNNTASLVLITVNDKFGNELQGVKVTIQRWLSDAWVTDQILSTDFQGRTEGYYVLSTVFYNHVLEFNGVTRFGIINDDTNKKLIFAEDVANGINFNIDILGGSDFAAFYSSVLDVSYNISFENRTNTSGYFRFFWSDNTGASRTGCLDVVFASNGSSVCHICATTATGTIFCFVNQTVDLSLYNGAGSIDGVRVVSTSSFFGDFSNSIVWGSTGYFVAFFLVVVAFFAFIESPAIGLMLGTGVVVVLGMFGIIFKDVSMAAFIGLLVVSFLIARIKSSGGVNG